eukprot:589982_1
MVALILGVTFVMGIAGLATTRAWAKIEVRYSEPIGAALSSASSNGLLQVSTLSGDANMVSIEIGSLNAVAQAGLQSKSGGIGGGSSGGGDGGSSSGGGNGGSSSGGGNGGGSSGGGSGGIVFHLVAETAEVRLVAETAEVVRLVAETAEVRLVAETA